ncbi:MAG TPA: UDP-glucose 4-epimerase GalE, partial [Candidatus Binatia bacterium]
MNMNILITGAGLIGSNCARQAVDAGNKVVLFDLSPNRDYLQKVVGQDRAEVVAADMRDLPALLSA